jgi:hypothetical protein
MDGQEIAAKLEWGKFVLAHGSWHIPLLFGEDKGSMRGHGMDEAESEMK